MRYRNPPQPTIPEAGAEGREFLVLLAGVALIIGVLLGALILSANFLAPRIPFAIEQSLATSVDRRLFTEQRPNSPEQQARQTELERLAQRVAGAMNLPAGMTIHAHYVDAPTINAMATLGGHVFVFQGLLDKLGSEDALTAVLAHEIGHVRERHVIQAMGRGIVMVAGLSAIGVKSQGLNRWALERGGQLTALSYSREAEAEADLAGLEGVQALYGHAGGVEQLFAVFTRLEAAGLDLVKSHPHSAHRRLRLAQLAEQRRLPLHGRLTPLSRTFAQAVRAAASPSAGPGKTP